MNHIHWYNCWESAKTKLHFLLRATEIDLHFSVTSVLSFPRGNGKKEPGKKEPYIVFSRRRREIFWIFKGNLAIQIHSKSSSTCYRIFRYFWFETLGSHSVGGSFFSSVRPPFPRRHVTRKWRSISVALMLPQHATQHAHTMTECLHDFVPHSTAQ